MENRTLEQAFNAVFHKKESFSDFLTLDNSTHIEEIPFKGRKVYRTTKELKNHLRFIDKVVLRHLDKNDAVVHSYIKERSALTAVKAHAGNRYFFLTDIKDFFSNISKENVTRILERDKNLIPISDIHTHIEKLSTITTLEGILPVGFPTSPRLSNAFLLEFDNAVYAMCQELDLVYTRYADDIIISGISMDLVSGLREKIQAMLHQNASTALFLNLDKTKITHTGNKVKILGLVITPDGRVTIDSKYKKLLESLLYFYTNDQKRYEDLLNRTFGGSEHSLFGMLHYVRSTDPLYLGNL